jgi:hypothetical protein
MAARHPKPEIIGASRLAGLALVAALTLLPSRKPTVMAAVARVLIVAISILDDLLLHRCALITDAQLWQNRGAERRS